MGEVLIILFVVVLLVGAQKLPQLGAGLGKGIRNFRRAAGGADDAPTHREGRREPPSGEG